MPWGNLSVDSQLGSGRLRERITFLAQATGADVSGASFAWVPTLPPDVTRAEIISVSGTDIIRSGQDLSQVQAIVTFRYKPPGRSPNQRFTDSRGNIYVIKAIRDIDPGKLISQEMICLLIGNQH